MSDQNSGSLDVQLQIGTDPEGRTVRSFIQGIILGPVCKYFSLVLSIIALLLDPLFCYVLVVVVVVEEKCLGLEKTLGAIASILRSVIDLCYMVYQYRVRTHVPPLPESWFYVYVICDVLIILPLPQALVFYVIPELNDPKVFNVTALLSFIFTIQYVLRVARIYSLLKKAIRACRIHLNECIWANLILLMLAGHVVGSFWYLFAIEREVTCWLEVCKYFGAHCSLYCDGTFKTTTYLKDSCSTNSPNSIPFDFGIYSDAIDSGVVDSVGLIQRISYCFWWGLQNLSSLGHNLKPSAYLWEVYFSVFILISGLILITALINGTMQTYVLSRLSRQETTGEN